MVARLPTMTVGGQNMDEEDCNEDFDLDYVVNSDQCIIDDVKKVCVDLKTIYLTGVSVLTGLYELLPLQTKYNLEKFKSSTN